MTTKYRHLASEVGCLSAEIYKEIRRCLRLRGGVMHDGIKWIWKTSEELAERLGCNEKTIRRHLKRLVELGWLKREQLQKRWGMRAYHYSLGDDAPLKAVAAAINPQMPVQTRRSVRTEADTMSGSINRNSTFTNSLPGHNSRNSQGASRQTEQFHHVAGGESQAIKQPDIKGREGGIRTLSSTKTEAEPRTLRSIAATGISRRSDLYKSSQTEQLDPLVSGSNCTTHRPQTSVSLSAVVPSHWPEEDMTTSLKVQVIEAARQLAFPGRHGRFAAA